MEKPTLVKIYQADRFIGRFRPLIVTTAQSEQYSDRAEYFLIVDLPTKIPTTEMLRWRMEDIGMPTRSKIKLLDSLEALARAQGVRAEDALWHIVWETDKALHRLLYETTRPISFAECSSVTLEEYYLHDKGRKAIGKMFAETVNAGLRKLGEEEGKIDGAIRFLREAEKGKTS